MSRGPVRSKGAGSDVTIVGAGTAGLFAAYLLAREGARVSVFDSAEQLGPPGRTFIITSRLQDVLGFEPSAAIVNRTPNLQVISPHRQVSIGLREPDLIVEREALVRLLAEKAADAGAEIRLGTRFVGLAASKDGFSLGFEAGTTGRVEHVHATHVIGADGAHSQVARVTGLAGYSMLSLLQARVALPSWAQADTTRVWFNPQATRFFFWLEPESDSRAVVGLIANDAKEAHTALSHFLAAHHLEPSGYQSAEIPCYRRGARVSMSAGGACVYLIGDAAGQVKVTTVGGVVTGLRGAQAAVRAILRGTNYGRELWPLQRELDLHLLIHRVVSRCSGRDYDDLLTLSSGRVAGALGAHTRDEAARLLLPSLLAQPRFVLLATKCLLRRAPHQSSRASGDSMQAAQQPAVSRYSPHS